MEYFAAINKNEEAVYVLDDLHLDEMKKEVHCVLSLVKNFKREKSIYILFANYTTYTTSGGGSTRKW